MSAWLVPLFAPSRYDTSLVVRPDPPDTENAGMLSIPHRLQFPLVGRRTAFNFSVIWIAASAAAPASSTSAPAIAGGDGGRASMDALTSGKPAGVLTDLMPYTGQDAWKLVAGPDRQMAYRLNYDQLQANYGDNVEFQLRRELVLLCSQTVDVLYRDFTPRRTRYRNGSRPALEKVVAEVTTGCTNQRDTALALMRFCRDLYKKAPGRTVSDTLYGGTEEQLIDKGEDLCECLGRLMVALCEVGGMPGRIVMHVVGGHICCEILIDGRWAYIDPRCGMYFLKPDGSLASVWDVWNDPGLIRRQPASVRADVSARWTWHQRAWACERKYFHPSEINGLMNYSLSDAGRYTYAQRTTPEATRAGLFEINKKYRVVLNDIFGLTGDGYQLRWSHQELRTLPLAYRHDGFSMYYQATPPMTRAILERTYLDPFKDTHASILVWGLGPGSVFCFDTKIGQVFGSSLTDEQWKMMRTGDHAVYENVSGLIREGNCPLKVAVHRGHELGRKIFARLEMNHEYGPASDTNWMWVGLVGDLNKRHPEYRIPGRVLLDFKHKAVRDFKIAILREAAEAGADGLEMDFAVYFPHFERPDKDVMTRFVRDVRAMLDEVGARQNRRIEIMTRVPFNKALDYGLDWKTWMTEGLIDSIVPTHHRPNETFDIVVDEFVSLGRQTGVKVFPTIWQALGFVTTDPKPGDEKKGLRRYSKPKSRGMYFAQALLFHRAGADGLQLGFSADEWVKMPWLNDLADPLKVRYADKHYMVDVLPHCPVTFPAGQGSPPGPREKTVPLRIGDDIPEARRAGYEVKAECVLYLRPLCRGERLSVFVNGQGPVELAGAAEPGTSASGPIDLRRPHDPSFIHDRDWWRRGETRVGIRADWLRLEHNEIRFVYRTESTQASQPFSITWVDLVLQYVRS
jgi:hypothetical protein